MKNNKRIICGFPAVGKSHFYNKHQGNMAVSDSDSSLFPKDESWPSNYIEHIRSLDGIIFVSTHKEVRDALFDAEIPFDLCYPARDCKEEYLERYKQRGSSPQFIVLLSKMWDQWISELEDEGRCENRYVLSSNQYISELL